ncbi:hypothetical protein Golomagni_05783 [Golovinomyces magnicellulatus]|nr:hypothetical protein Golomagni_05783 [Golovinomyces magnicellulatus]
MEASMSVSAMSMNEIHANSLLASTFSYPREVLANPFLDKLQKRCVLATWASDAFAVEGKPWLRQLPGSAMQVRIGDIIAALKMLDDDDGPPPSCLLHRFVKNEWRILSSQTIGVEFASKIIKVGTGSRRKRIKLQLWDTAGTERFRSVSRSYYRGAAGAILVYDIASHNSFRGIQPFLNDARALASPNLSLMLVGNKLDLATDPANDPNQPPPTPSSVGSASTITAGGVPSSVSTTGSGSTIRGRDHGGSISSSQQRATFAPEGREVSTADATRWASTAGISVVTEVSALNGEGVDEIFTRLATMILTKIELGDIDPDDPMSGIQYGDGGGWNGTASDGGSIKSHMTGGTIEEGAGGLRRRRKPKNRSQNWSGIREWEEVFTLSSGNRRRGRNCC